ncbi:MAG: hypothetical protein UT65_C0018G0006 [Parcubacteria group bacterium GW2011_GWF2_39_8b]|uniref:DUF6036 domain-containing protein n=1 Tax=Candidatus Zambryskibacteria bacterium RIFCSPHIGHO2_02_38_10.5 TaxID=1802742 RepID=A0A1G2T8K6_9BACT|nr:MAG: hypothetical protein UT65_C0018G0006 [Parcubacteria group bacterium GW2011_GWF2_39_8b]KKR45551.1 MAG: hypothetical protein UT81_C0011G0015 [Parcubacteria group bacterium GW2011_GWA2_40_14]OHA93615.1 MAG: hypothetical protein A2W58_01670 [Candidatus Zambryskibacteria bacterium RIFCSPHIGHO2_02_38_10.5]OHA96252.1 MAG: hypothetical protein A3C63_02425 [Candidatus Zambryskibacteria bacterium RIFCSPHIGHO2_02_FULL_39_82]OHB08816.1 MAG: hypothetical protein A2W64_02770 [Candidatus Zambryskibact
MTKEDIINKVKILDLPKGSYIVFGSCPLAVLGIREANDIDLLVSQEIYEKLKKDGWEEIDKGPNDKPLVQDVFEAHNNWNFSSYKPTLKDLLVNAMEVDGITFASLEDVRKWKVASGRPKDVNDIKMIDNYFDII